MASKTTGKKAAKRADSKATPAKKKVPSTLPKRRSGVQAQPAPRAKSPKVTQPPAASSKRPAKTAGARSSAASTRKAPAAPVRKPVATRRRTPVAPVGRPAKAVAPPAPTAPAPRPAPAPAPKRQTATAPQTLEPPKARRERKPVTIPPILLEGDAPSVPRPSGPGERFVLSPAPVVQPESVNLPQVELPQPAAAAPKEPPSPEQPALEPPSLPQPAVVPEVPVELPESYGTERLFLTARDPHWLHAAWDLALERQMRLNRMSRDGHLVVRAHAGDATGPVASEAHVHPESKSWFLHVPGAATRYSAELGYYDSGGAWHSIATSDSAVTPPDTSSESEGVEFVTIPPEVPLQKIFEAVQEAVQESVPLVEAVSQSLPTAEPVPSQPVELRPQAPGPAEPPAFRPPPTWTPARASALAEIVRVDDSRRVWVGSLEVTEMVRRHLKHEITSPAPGMEAAEAAAVPPGPAPAEVSSAAAVPEREGAEWERGFWFNLNAELVLYGATEPDAKVTVDGRQIRLRPDGTFSYRFALPDGRYPLAIAAETVDGKDRKSARLEFSRTTSFDGAGVHAQDAELKLPAASNMT